MIQYLIYLLFFISGACGLIYELVWLRKLSLIFGNTTYATSCILTAFMGGLALGSYILGKYVDKAKSPLKLYGFLELGIALSATAILFLFLPLSDNIYIWAFNNLNQSAILINIIRFLLCILLLIIPTTLMGGSLPVISKFCIHQSETFGRKIGYLYAINTFGGVIGVFFTGYYFIRLFGESTTLWLAIIGNLVVSLIALWLGQKQDIQKTFSDVTIKTKKRSKTTGPPPTGKTLKIRHYSPKTAKLVLWIFAVAGFTSLAYEVIWTRALIFYVSSTTYSFTIILVTFLLGITLGSLLMSKWIDRLKNLILWFGLFEVLIAMTAILSIPLLKNMDVVQQWILKYIHTTEWSQVTLLMFVTTFIILVLPTLFMGAVFPIVNRICVESLQRLGRGVGSVYMSNTVGAIIGSFASGFIILPLLGLQKSILFLSVVNLLIGIYITFFEDKKSRTYFISFSSIAVILFIAINILFFTTEPLFTGVVSFKNTKILYSKDCTAATLSALEKRDETNLWGDHVRYLNINGHNTAHTTFADIIIHKTLAHLPMLIHPNPKKALVIGFGFGNTCQSFLQYDIERLDCVELLANEKESAEFFKKENHGVFEDPRFRFIVGDGRNYTLAAKKKYDIISINAVDPKFSPTLYTNEFYGLCKQRLNQNGLVVAWLPLYGMTLDEVLSLAKSFVVAFPHSSLWYNNPEHLLLLGSNVRHTVNLQQLNARLSNPKVKKNLAAIRLENPYSLLSTFLMGEEGLAELTENAELHSDNHPIVEFCRVTESIMYPEVYQTLLAHKESIITICEKPDSTLIDPETVKTELNRYEEAMLTMLKGLFEYRIAVGNIVADSSQFNQAFRWMREAIDSVPENKFNLLFFVDWVHHNDLQASKKYFEQAIVEEPNFAKAFVLIGLESAERGEWDTALNYYQKAIALNDRFVSPYFNAGFAYAQKQDWQKAALAFEKVVALNADYGFGHSSLAQIYYMQQKYDKAIEHAKISIKLMPGQANLYFNLGMTYQKKQQIPEAIKAFEKGLKLAPNDARAQKCLYQLKES